jgi:hypothetical protein
MYASFLKIQVLFILKPRPLPHSGIFDGRGHVHSKIGNLVLRARSEIIGSVFRNKKARNPKHEIRNNTKCPESK